MKKLSWTEHQKMDSLKVKVRNGTITPKEQIALDKLVTRWKTVGDVPPKVLSSMFRF
jgi:hypothetical protein